MNQNISQLHPFYPSETRNIIGHIEEWWLGVKYGLPLSIYIQMNFHPNHSGFSITTFRQQFISICSASQPVVHWQAVQMTLLDSDFPEIANRYQKSACARYHS